jgi:hypothetical protein
MVAPPVRFRAFALGLVLVPLNVYLILFAELRWYLILTLNPLFVTPVFFLLVLVGLNAILRPRHPSLTLRPAELVVIYVMLVMSCTVATHDFIINLMALIGWPAYAANAQNAWESRLFPLLPKWMFPWDKELLTSAFTGRASLYRWDVLLMWLAPLAWWFLFILAIGWSMLCLNVLIRKAWVDDTRLSFPIVRLPLALTEEPVRGSMLRSRALWIGFTAAMLLDLINGLHDWYPNLPHFQTLARWLQFPTPPWNLTHPFVVTFYPFAIGLAFLVPLDVSFSCWFFYLFMKLQIVLGYQFGYGDVPDFPYITEQAIGAWYAFGFYLLWVSRGHLKRVLRIALRSPGDRQPDEPMSYRTALVGLVAGMAVFFGFWWAAGMSPVWCLVTLGTYFLLALSITRVRAEAGGQHTVWDLEPMRLMRLFDSRSLGANNIAMAGISHWYWRLNRSHVMPSQLEALRLGQEHGMRLRGLVLPMMAAFALATAAGMWAVLDILHRHGAQGKCVGFPMWTIVETYNFIDTGVGAGFRSEPGRWSAVGLSATFLGALAWLRTRFTWWPLHPLGYCIGPGLLWLWCPFFVAWLLKWLILRYGGLSTYRRALPFFLGLVLGDYTAGALWALVGLALDTPTYRIFH